MAVARLMTDYCYHCDLAVPKHFDYSLLIDGEVRHFCCPGCLAAATTISNCGLDAFYRLRDKSQSQVDVGQNQANEYSYLDQPGFQHPALSRDGNNVRLSLSLLGLTCSACVWLIESYLTKLDGVKKVTINQVNRRALVEFDSDRLATSQIIQSIVSLGYQATLERGSERQKLLQQEQKQSLMRLGVAAIGMMQVGMYAIALHAGALQGISDPVRDLMRHAALLICTLIVFYSAKPFFQAAWTALKNRSLVMDVPVSVAIMAAYGASLWSTLSGGKEVYFDSVAMFTFFLLLSRYWEARARSRLDMQPVQSLIPDLAILTDTEGGFTQEIDAGQLKLGDIVLIEPGKRIPADLRVLQGSGAVDESILSGEFSPVTHEIGDELVAGSLNGEGRFIGEVIRLQQDSSLAIVDRLYDEALMRRVSTKALADRWAGVFIALVLSVAAATYLAWLFIDPAKAFWIMLSVLVVSCPCALSLATPTSITAALYALRGRGVLVRHSAVLDQIGNITDVVFDKTGTLTEGKAHILECRTTGSVSEEECRAIASSLESHSTHPFARAFRNEQYEMPSIKIDKVKVISGKGVEAYWRGQSLRIGNAAFIGEILSDTDIAIEQLADSPDDKFISLYLASESELLAVFVLEDPVKTSAPEALDKLRELGLRLHMLSGDPSSQCAQVAADLGIQFWHNQYSAADKLAYLEKLKATGAQVLLVGDGINDVPAMGLSDVSLVVAQAPDLVQARADIGLVGTDLRVIPQIFTHSQRLSRILRQNIIWAIGYNITAIPAAAAGYVAPWLAAIGMSLSSAVVLLNALRLKKMESENHGAN